MHVMKSLILVVWCCEDFVGRDNDLCVSKGCGLSLVHGKKIIYRIINNIYYKNIYLIIVCN